MSKANKTKNNKKVKDEIELEDGEELNEGDFDGETLEEEDEEELHEDVQKALNVKPKNNEIDYIPQSEMEALEGLEAWDQKNDPMDEE